MSEESKPKTMIGTVAPITRPPTHGGVGAAAPQAPRAPTAPPVVSSHAAATIVPPQLGAAPPPPAYAPPSGYAPQPSMPAISYGTGMAPPGASGSQPYAMAQPLVTSAPTAGLPAGQAAAWAAAASTDSLVGQELCGYVIRRKLAEGGMGVVYAGENEKIGRVGAIKVLKLELCQSEEVIERFYQEARAVNEIRHENIVDIYDFGRDAVGRVFFVMEYLEGEPLSGRLRRGPLAWGEAFPILDQTLRALKAAHDKGFVHRDLKPDNIWLRASDNRMQVKLLDFGIAKLVGTESPKEKLTQTGSVIGTPHYMSPEQINGSRDIDHRTDIYAMGIIVYEMFTGRTPFVGDTLMKIMTGHLFEEAPRLADIPPMLGVPPPVAEIVERMLAKDAASRYENVSQVLADLHDIHRHQAPKNASSMHHTRPLRPATLPALPNAAPVGLGPVAQKPAGKGRALLLGGVAAAALAAGAAFAVPAMMGKSEKEAVVVTPETKVDAGPGEVIPPPEAPEPSAQDVRSASFARMDEALAHGEPGVRQEGTRAVAKVQRKEAVPKLLELAEKDADLPTRKAAATALGALDAQDATRLLAELEAAALPALAVHYTAALAALGHKGADKRLAKAVKSDDLAVSVPAARALAAIAKAGDKKVIGALREVAGALEGKALEDDAAMKSLVEILTSMASLRDAAARQNLLDLLKHPQEAVQLASAEGLSRLGDDAGKEVLAKATANTSSPNQLVAAVALVQLGDYSGSEVIANALDAKEIERRRLAAGALGDLGQKESLRKLFGIVQDGKADWQLRVIAATAAIRIVGLDAKALASASVDWTQLALDNPDWATRHAAAGVLADLPAKDAVPLLSKAIRDGEKKVRLRASQSARKMKTPEAAREVVAAVKQEKDPQVREEQVKALGEIGQAEAKDTLVELSQEPGRLGVLAAGSLIAVGDDSGAAKLDLAMGDRATSVRLAVMEAAAVAQKDIVLPALRKGVDDKVFDVQLGAAEGLSLLKKEKDAALPILTKASKARDTATVTRAMVALTRFGVAPQDAELSPAQLVDSQDPEQRLAAVSVVQEMPLAQKLPLLRRLLADPDNRVRRAGVEIVETVAQADKQQAIKLYKPLVTDADDVVRSKAAGQLSRLVDVPKQVAPPVGDKKDNVKPATTDDLDKVKAAGTKANDALERLKREVDKAKKAAEEVEAAAQDKTSDDSDKRAQEALKELQRAKEEASKELLAAKAEHAEQKKAAGDTPSAAAQTELKGVSDALDGVRPKVEELEELEQKAKRIVQKETEVDIGSLLRTANKSIARGRWDEAERQLADVASALKKRGDRNGDYELAMGRFHYGKADLTDDAPAKRKHLMRAQEAGQRAARLGKGAEAQKLFTDIAAELAKLDK